MKNLYKLKAMRSIAIIALVAVIGFSFASCKEDGGKEDEGDILDGTIWWVSWVNNDDTLSTATLVFSSPNFAFVMTIEDEVFNKWNGTYSISGSTVTFTVDGGDFIVNGETITGTLYDDYFSLTKLYGGTLNLDKQ